MNAMDRYNERQKMKKEAEEIIASLPEVINAVPCKAGERRRGRSCWTPEALAEAIVKGCLGITPPCDEEGLRYRDDDFILMKDFLPGEARTLLHALWEAEKEASAEFWRGWRDDPRWRAMRVSRDGDGRIKGGRGGTGKGFLED